MKKVGILTITDGANYGNRLQNYAMQVLLTSLDLDVETIQRETPRDKHGIVLLKYLVKENIKRLIGRKNTYFALRERKRKFLEFNRKYIKFSNVCLSNNQAPEGLKNQYDYFICGSDQIWNYALTEGLHPAYFLDFARSDQRKIAYAPSINQTPIATQMKPQLVEKLESFSAISVREQDAAQQLTLWMHRSISAVLDPTLLLQASDYTPLVEKYSVQFPEHYIFIYCLHLNHLPFLRQYAEAYANSHNAKIVYCNKYDLREAPYAVNIFRYGPEAFVSGIKNADYIIADSFHAAALSIIFQKNFVIYAPDGCPSRMNTLFSSLGIGNRFITDIHQALPEIPYDNVNQNLSCLREASLDYLKNALE